MAITLNNVKIALRRDTLDRWNECSAQTLLQGEIAVVSSQDGDNLKIGNGISSFGQLPYLFERCLKTDMVTAKDITAKSISQGYLVKSTPTSFATGVLVEASANFDVAHGIEAVVSDDYAFVFNGVNFPGINQRYVSHGEGTFNINPVNGLSGFYIGDLTLDSILSAYLEDYYTKSEIEGQFVKLSSDTVQNISSDIQLSGYLNVGGMTVQGRKCVQIAETLIPLEYQSRTKIGQAYQLIADDSTGGYLKGHTYLLSVDGSDNLVYEDITVGTSLRVEYNQQTQDLSLIF